MFFYLTNVALDVSSGALWWLIKNTTYSAYRGLKYISYDRSYDKTSEPSDVILMKEIKLLRQEISEIKQA